ncbi:LPO_1073/Vpar_1526 family protein [Streptomyces sp. NPDC050528]|uniref:LPO_1073/Vpar_1526 family protein n=1 Tax=Streptomyces sp. NPDC050528 TaxID=3365623 RepID=UPI0037B13702
MKQTQRSGDNSTNYQAEVINTGVSYRDAKEIAIDVFNENITKFAQTAHDTALERAIEFTENLLGDIPPESLDALRKPDVQRALFLAQQEFACSGEEYLGTVLLSLMKERLASQQRDIRQLALTEALKTAPKLADKHLAALGVALLLARTRLGAHSVSELHEKFKTTLVPLSQGLTLSDADIAYMEYTGCLSIQIGKSSIAQILINTYMGLFTTGFTKDQVPADVIDSVEPILRPCIRDASKLQVDAILPKLAVETLEGRGVKANPSSLDSLMRIGLMSDDEIRNEFSSIHPALSELATLWESTKLANCQLTTIGMTLGHTNAKRIIGDEVGGELNVWVH